jgi:hypothetical protein
MGFKNVGDIRYTKTGKSVEIRIYGNASVQGGESLYVDLDKLIQVLGRKMKKTSVARRI